MYHTWAVFSSSSWLFCVKNFLCCETALSCDIYKKVISQQQKLLSLEIFTHFYMSDKNKSNLNLGNFDATKMEIFLTLENINEKFMQRIYAGKWLRV